VAFAAVGGVPVHNWSGFYLGGTAGQAWGSLHLKTNTPFSGAYFPDTATQGAVNATGVQAVKPHGIPVGFEAGYNWQAPRSPWVLGIEADVQSLRLSGGVQSGPVGYPGFPGAFFTVSSAASADWLVTARPRLGFALDRWLFYVTGGLAVARPSAEYSFADSGGAIESATIARTRLGYAAGGGVEVALGNNWSAKAEYLFVDFRPSSILSSNFIALTTPLPAQPFAHSVDLKADILRLGLNYRFDPADVAAGAIAMPVKAHALPWNTWSWTGFYLGGHVGAAAGTTDFADPFGTSVFGDKASTPAFFGGGQIGYNWQPPRSPWVFGIEADASIARADGTVTCHEGSQQQIGATCESRPRATGTVTARLGYALGPSGRTLVYGKGGAAWAIDHFDMAGNVAAIPELTNSNTQSVAFWGGTAGIGIEQALTPAWSLKIEYDYVGFALRHVANVGSMTCVPVFGGCVLTTILQPGTSGVTQNLQELKVGLNYRLGADPWARWPSAVRCCR
jgi:outer membrane immunogenic protein